MKVKNIIYGLVSVAMTAPASALAQFETPTTTGLPSGSVTGIITNGMNWLLMMVGILGVVGFVIAGIIYLTAAGDEDQIERGKRTMINSIIGVIVSLIGLVFINAIKGMLGGNSKNF